MAKITEILKNCTIATVAKSATMSNGNLTYVAGGRPGANIHLFTKTITRAAGHIFKTEPSISLSETLHPQNYTVVVTDTGSIVGGNLTVRAFNVFYKLPSGSNSSSDVLRIQAKAERADVASTGKITGFDLKTGVLPFAGGERTLNIYGDVGATVTVEVKETTANPDVNTTSTTSIVAAGGNESGTRTIVLTLANPNIFIGMTVTGTNIANNSVVTSINLKTITVSVNTTAAASGTLVFSGAFTAVIGANNVFTKQIKFPAATSNKSYSTTITRIASDSFIDSLAGLSTKTITTLQFPAITLTTTLINSSSNSGDWAIVAPAAITTTGLASQEGIVFPVSWTVRAASAGEIAKTNAGFVNASFSTSALTAVAGIQVGGTASTASYITLINPSVKITNIGTFTNLSAVGVSGTKLLTLAEPQLDFYIGMPVSGTNIPSSSVIASIASNQQITLNNTLTGATTVATFSGKPYAVIKGEVVVLGLGKASTSTNIEINNILTLNN